MLLSHHTRLILGAGKNQHLQETELTGRLTPHPSAFPLLTAMLPFSSLSLPRCLKQSLSSRIPALLATHP